MPKESFFSSEAWAEPAVKVQEQHALVTKDSNHQELVEALAAETKAWPRTGASADQTVRTAFRLVCEAAGGVLMIVGPRTTLRRLRENCSPAGANLTKQVKGKSIGDQDFRNFFLNFTRPSSDRLLAGKLDGKACQSQIQDAILLVAAAGDVMMCSTAVAGLPPTPLVWPGHGRRHAAALEVASFLDRVVVIVRSNGGAVHALARRTDNIVMAWRLQGRVVVTTSEEQSRKDSKEPVGSCWDAPSSYAASRMDSKTPTQSPRKQKFFRDECPHDKWNSGETKPSPQGVSSSRSLVGFKEKTETPRRVSSSLSAGGSKYEQQSQEVPRSVSSSMSPVRSRYSQPSRSYQSVDLSSSPPFGCRSAQLAKPNSTETSYASKVVARYAQRSVTKCIEKRGSTRTAVVEDEEMLD